MLFPLGLVPRSLSQILSLVEGKDSWKIHNLADSPAYGSQLSEFRTLIRRWIMDTDDQGRFQESLVMFDSDMEVYVEKIRKRRPESAALIDANIALVRQWRAEGK